MTWMLHYAAKAWTLLTLVPAVSESIEAGAKATTPEKPTRPLCEKPYVQRSSLTRHSKVHHIDRGTFSCPFPCPQCCRDGLDAPAISSAAEWSNHVEQNARQDALTIGYASAPRRRRFPPLKAPARRRKTTSTKRKRDDAAKPSIPGVLVFDISEETLPKKAREHKDEVGAMSVKLESPYFFDMPVLELPTCDPRFDLGNGNSNSSDPSSTSSDSGDSRDGCSLASSVDTIDTPPESPVSFSFETFPIDNPLLASTDDGACWSFETCSGADEAGWEFVASVGGLIRRRNGVAYMRNGRMVMIMMRRRRRRRRAASDD